MNSDMINEIPNEIQAELDNLRLENAFLTQFNQQLLFENNRLRNCIEIYENFVGE